MILVRDPDFLHLEPQLVASEASVFLFACLVGSSRINLFSRTGTEQQKLLLVRNFRGSEFFTSASAPLAPGSLFHVSVALAS